MDRIQWGSGSMDNEDGEDDHTVDELLGFVILFKEAEEENNGGGSDNVDVLVEVASKTIQPSISSWVISRSRRKDVR